MYNYDFYYGCIKFSFELRVYKGIYKHNLHIILSLFRWKKLVTIARVSQSKIWYLANKKPIGCTTMRKETQHIHRIIKHKQLFIV